MSGLGDFFMGSEGRPGRVVDVTPEAFQRLQSPVARALMRALSSPERFEGPFVADMTDRESQLLDELNQFQQPEAFQQQALQSLGMLPQEFQQGAIQNIQGGPQNELLEQTLRGDFLSPESNPFLQQSIEAAQRPLLERFEQQMGDKRGEFTQAGHFVQPGSSSPFETAEARMQTGLANAMGDVSTQMVSENYARERQAQQNAVRQFLQNQQIGANIESNLANQIMQAGQLGSEIESGIGERRLQTLLSNLEAQALPRMIEQQGIDRGLEEFRRERDELLQLLGVGGELGTPITATFQPTRGSPGALGGLFSGLGSGLGTGLGGMMAGGGGQGGGEGGGGSFLSSLGSMFGFGGAGAGGGGAAGGGIAGAWPAALAALIVGNEAYAADRGYRSDDTMTHLRDALTGRVVYQDMDQRFLPEVFSDDNPFGQDLRSMFAFSGFDWDNTVRHGRQGTLSGFWDLFG